jgi:uncharacterized protein DUF2844
MKKRFGTRLLVGATFLASASSAWAALGQPAASIENDRAAMQGELKVISADAFSVRQITTPGGTVVNEYVSPSGLVFGVSWRGPVYPNLSQLLGNYFAQFQSAARAQAPLHRRHIFVHTPELVAESGGHMRDFRGRAYLPASLPPGVSEASVR